MTDAPCRRHLTVDCDIQRCAEERRGSRRAHADSTALEQARAELQAMRRTRLETATARQAVDETYRSLVHAHPTPTGHTNRPGVMRQWRRSRTS